MDYLEDILELVKRNLITICAVLFGIAVSVGSLIYVNVSLQSCEECEPCEEVQIPNDELPKVEPSTKKVSVDVKGAVKKAGVYELPLGSNIQMAIEAAGGVTSKASTVNVNLSKRITDEMVVYIFTKDELKKKETSNEVVCEVPKCECETVTITQCPEVNGNDKDKTDTEKPSTDNKEENDSKVSINTGTMEELLKLDGIGESKAKAIIEYREKNGPFKQIEDIMNVSGIGSAMFEKIKERLIL